MVLAFRTLDSKVGALLILVGAAAFKWTATEILGAASQPAVTYITKSSTGNTYSCGGSVVNSSQSSDETTCKARCDSDPSCRYYSYWQTSAETTWCRLTTNCSEIGKYEPPHLQTGTNAYINEKVDGYKLEAAAGNVKSCGGAVVNSSESAGGGTECQQRCDGAPDCRYFSYWKTSSATTWCRLTTACSEAGKYAPPYLQTGANVNILKKSDGYNLVSLPDNVKSCGGSVVNSSLSEGGPAECKRRCDGAPACAYFSYWQTDQSTNPTWWCRLTTNCSELGKYQPTHLLTNTPVYVFQKIPTIYKKTAGISCGGTQGGCQWSQAIQWGGGIETWYSPDGTSEDGCKSACNAHADCAGFNYEPVTTRCYYRAFSEGGVNCYQKDDVNRDCYEKQDCSANCCGVKCGGRCLQNAQRNSKSGLPNCWLHNGDPGCTGLVGYRGGVGPYPCSDTLEVGKCRADSNETVCA